MKKLFFIFFVISFFCNVYPSSIFTLKTVYEKMSKVEYIFMPKRLLIVDTEHIPISLFKKQCYLDELRNLPQYHKQVIDSEFARTLLNHSLEFLTILSLNESIQFEMNKSIDTLIPEYIELLISEEEATIDKTLILDFISILKQIQIYASKELQEDIQKIISWAPKTEGLLLSDAIQLFETTELEKDYEKSPEKFDLFQNFPNPFNSSTKIAFSLATKCHINISIYNLLSERVTVLLDDYYCSGQYEIIWNGLDLNGLPVPSGQYVVKLATPAFSKIQKMILIR
ncbi:hypothetical protein JW935_27055 [candidate division KSB1 bacterium]|nr:hypothetical protein [candidate division KSB1 bacterium]